MCPKLTYFKIEINIFGTYFEIEIHLKLHKKINKMGKTWPKSVKFIRDFGITPFLEHFT